MEYCKTVTLKNGAPLVLRSATYDDGEAVFRLFNDTHGETDYLLSYPDENSFDPMQESEFLQKLAESENSVMLLSFVNGVLCGTASIEAVGAKYKVRHRAEFGITVSRAYWGLGIGRKLTDTCIECAAKAGYSQLELSVVANNKRAVSLYEKVGFTEFGRNPRGFNSRTAGYQTLVDMRLELNEGE